MDELLARWIVAAAWVAVAAGAVLVAREVRRP